MCKSLDCIFVVTFWIVSFIVISKMCVFLSSDLKRHVWQGVCCYVILVMLSLSLTHLISSFLQRQTHLECFHGSWDRVVSCQPVDCGPPDQSYIYHAIFSCPWGTTFGKQCSFTCGSPAILQGKLWICRFCVKKKGGYGIFYIWSVRKKIMIFLGMYQTSLFLLTSEQCDL